MKVDYNVYACIKFTTFYHVNRRLRSEGKRKNLRIHLGFEPIGPSESPVYNTCLTRLMVISLNYQPFTIIFSIYYPATGDVVKFSYMYMYS